jgi:hypothetical protein
MPTPSFSDDNLFTLATKKTPHEIQLFGASDLEIIAQATFVFGYAIVLRIRIKR